MPIGITYALGKDCVLTIQGVRVYGISDVAVRETTSEIDATFFGASSSATVIVGRSYEILLSVPSMQVARYLYSARWTKSGDFLLQGIFDVTLSGGLFDIDGQFTIHEVDADEPIDGAVIPRFALRSWYYQHQTPNILNVNRPTEGTGT
jgi:hypothetical protein